VFALQKRVTFYSAGIDLALACPAAAAAAEGKNEHLVAAAHFMLLHDHGIGKAFVFYTLPWFPIVNLPAIMVNGEGAKTQALD
jgi:hypothetical protein